MIKKMTCSIAAILGVSSLALATPERPPQYILMAFDGSKSIEMWDKTNNFSKVLTEKNSPLKFTYFISGVYWLSPKTSKVYEPPRKNKGASAIGFGDSSEDVSKRIDKINEVFHDGHEMGSHANGHFDATELKWNEADWDKEFSEFNKLIFEAAKNNGLPEDKKVDFRQEEVVGFRAPLLERATGLYNVLLKYKFRYDTSRVADRMDYWPEKISGIWNFPLAPLKIAGTAKKTLSMDYNFYYTDSKGVSDAKNSSLYEEQMYNTYLNYFTNNYNSNRAPLHIGHHFSQWNGGAYWRAMQRFAKTVCGLPEVKCVTYKELADYMDSLPSETLAAYKKGAFEKGAQFAKGKVQPLNVNVSVSTNNNKVIAEVSGIDSNDIDLAWEVNGELVSNSAELELANQASDKDVLTLVGTKNGKEIIRSSRIVTTDDHNNLTLSQEELETMKRCLEHNHDELE